ncbi:MAG: LysM peptidoglycan-binding domain-containing protein [Bacteroidetes bacterium]|nr:LysM peptidoglycan-binding domain-containing protein [Bacteroidota bacterium]
MKIMNWKYRIIILLLISLTHGWALPAISQEVTKSQITEIIDGQEYYLHFVKSGETLYNIARAYGITVNDIFKSNPDSQEGIRAGNILKIPAEEKAVQKKEETTELEKPTYFYHIVKKQETLYALSRKYNVPVDAIRSLNPDTGLELQEGATLRIPYAGETSRQSDPVPSESSSLHIIAAGETLYGIARQYNITTGEIINANPGINPTDLDIGQKIVIPNQQVNASAEASSKENEKDLNYSEHTVEKGETLYSIAREYAVSMDSIKKYNNGLTLNLYIGQKIKIPNKTVERGYIVYKPDKREKLEDIADKYRIEYEEVSEINPDINRKARKGQTVKIPVEKPEITTKNETDQNLEKDPTPMETPCPEDPKSHTNTFNIALMLPLFLEEVDSLQAYESRGQEAMDNFMSFRFLNFYAGFKMAADSMKRQGMKLNLFVYDIDNDPEKANQVLQQSELSSMDLIVGPLFAKSFAKVARFARTYEIPIVNPLSTRSEIIANNPWVFKIKPDEEMQTDLLVKYILNQYPESNIVIARHNKYQYQATVSYIRNYLNANRPGHVMIPNSKIAAAIAESEEDQIFTENKVLEEEMIKRSPDDSTWFSNLVKEITYVDDSVTGLEMNLSAIRNNVVIAISDDIVFSKEIMSQLNKLQLDHDITLFGLPDWNRYTDLETNQLLNLHVHTFTSSLIDYHDPRVKNWIASYRMRYQTEPTTTNYAFDGFDAGWYFLNVLYRYGKDFRECVSHYHIPLIQSQFKFESKTGNGFQNIYWNMGEYEGYHFREVKLPQIPGTE